MATILDSTLAEASTTTFTAPEGGQILLSHGHGKILIEESDGQGGWGKIYEGSTARRGVVLHVTNAAWRVKNLDAVNDCIVSIETVEAPEILGQPSVARQLAAGSTSANTALTASCRRISMVATGAAVRYAIGTTSQMASGTSHLIRQDERLDIAVPAGANIGIIRAASTDAVLEISELV